MNGPAIHERKRKGRNTKNMKRLACPHDYLTALNYLRRGKQSQPVTQSMSLADAITIACSVRHDVNMQMVGVRRISSWTKHGREP